MSVNEEEAATSAPADVILLEGGEKGKDEKIKYTSLMETTLLCNRIASASLWQQVMAWCNREAGKRQRFQIPCNKEC